MTRIVAISDTHEQHAQVVVPPGDILIHSGDFTYLGKIPAVANFAKWMGSQPHAHKICIAGNHELTLQSPYRNMVINLLKENGITYLEDSGIEINNFFIWGSPWTPFFNDWAFNLPRRSMELQAKWDLIPDKTNILITHGPPHGILDDTINNGSQGCEMLALRIKQLPNLNLCCYGHLHKNGSGVEEHNGVKFVNAAICTDAYKPTNLPVVIDI
jgi:predicted phosphohydrolase